MIIQVISRKKNMVLVEYTDEAGPHRVILPESEVYEEEGQFHSEDPTLGAPYGVDWETIFADIIGDNLPEVLAAAFRKSGIWTEQDFDSRTGDIPNLFLSTLGIYAHRVRREIHGHQ